MPSTKKTSLFGAVLLAAAMFAAAPQSASAQQSAVQPIVHSADPATVSHVITAHTFTRSHIFIAVCNAQAPGCHEFLQSFRLNAALLEGGWTGGVQNMHSAEFYSLDATPANLTALSKLCAAPSGRSAMKLAACQALTAAMTASGSQAPQMIMINRQAGTVEVVKGKTDQQVQSRAIVNFVKK